MEKIICYLLFALGIALVVKGGDIFVDAASWIAKAFGIPSFIIGATIVSLATTLPEMLVSAIAAGEGKTDMAIGNAVGSVTANTGLIMAIAMIAMGFICKRADYLKQCILLIAAASVLWVSCLSGELSIIGSLALAVIFVVFMYFNVMHAKNQKDTENAQGISDKKQLAFKIVLFLVGAAAIVAGSQLMVNNGSKIAEWLGVPERVIALTLVAIGTSLPELVTTITAIVKKESALSIGNIIGANIIDLSLILPVCSLVSGKPLPVAASSIRLDLPVCLGIVLIALVPIIVKEKSYRWQGIVMAAGYIAYLIAVI